MREFAVLVAVFASLDILLSNRLTLWIAILILLVVAPLWALGAFLSLEHHA